ncbi:MAG: hypothetical protein JSV09_12180, partial [Thermoplasmata archaeon]
MKHKFRDDEWGVEAIPMKLIVIAVILAIIIPSIIVGMVSWSNSQSETNLESEIDKIVETVQQTYEADAGTSFTIKPDIQDGMTKKIDYVKLGDKIGEHGGPYQSVIRDKFKDGDVRYTTIVDPNIMTTHPENRALELGSGKKTLIAEKQTIGETGFVVVRFPEDEGEIKMADCTVYEEDIKLEKGGKENKRYYKTINISIRNIGNLDTDSSPWPMDNGTGDVKVTAYDKLVLTGEIRELRTFANIKVEDYSVGPIEEDGSFDLLIKWYPVGENDDPQNTSLLKREIIVYVDTQDDVDEISRYNNMGSRLFVNEPPFINYVDAKYDENTPGLGSYITGIECQNEIYVNATDADGDVMEIRFWYSNYQGKEDKFYPEDKKNESAVDETPPDAVNNFRTDLDMGKFSQSTILTTKAFDDWGCGGDPFNTTIWMEQKPQWMEGLVPQYTDFVFDYINETYLLEVVVPKAVFEEYEFDYVYPNLIPFLAGIGSIVDDPGYITIKYPFDEETLLITKNSLNFKPQGIGLDIHDYVDAYLGIGKPYAEVNKDNKIEIKDMKILFTNAIVLKTYKSSFEDMLEYDFSHIEWNDLFEPSEDAYNTSSDFIAYLGTISNALNGNEIYSPIKDSVDVAKEIFGNYPDSFEELWALWQDYLTNLSHKSWLDSITMRGVGGLEWDRYLGHYDLFEMIEMAMPPGYEIPRTWWVFPPLLKAELFAVLEPHSGGFAEVGFSGDSIEGLVIDKFEIGISPTIFLKVGIAATAGLEAEIKGFGFGAGIRAVIQGVFGANPEVSVGYSTLDGFFARVAAAIDIFLQYFVEGFIEISFLFYTFTFSWLIWEGDNYPLWSGEWEYILKSQSPLEETENLTSDDTNVTYKEPFEGPSNVSIPRGPVIAVSSDGDILYVKSDDLETNLTQLPDYEIVYSWDGTNWYNITNNDAMETEPAAIFNSTGTPFVF